MAGVVALHLQAQGPAALEALPVAAVAGAEFGADWFTGLDGPGGFSGTPGAGVKVGAAALIAFQIQVEEGTREVLVDGQDTVLTPDGLFKRLTSRKVESDAFGGRIAADIVAGTLK